MLPETILGAKSTTVIIAFVGALVSVVLDIRNHDFWTAIGSIVAGVFVAYIATAPTVEFFGLSETFGHAIAGVFGIAGRNLVIWLRRVSKDPGQFLASLKGGKK